MKHKPKRRLKFTFRRQDLFSQLPPGELLLEQITDEQLLAIRGRAARIRKYHSAQFFELEAQRAAHKDEITKALQEAPGISVDIGGWCRAIKLRYVLAPLSCVGSMKQSGRFNYATDIDSARFPAFPALYIAEDRATAHCEMFGYTEQEEITGLSSEALALQADVSIGYLALTGRVNNVFDLTQRSNLKPFLKATARFKFTSDFRVRERALGIKPVQIARAPALLMSSFMDPAWRAFLNHVDLPANSQVFGQMVSAAGFEGILFKSVRTSRLVMAVFPRSFRNSNSTVQVVDPILDARCIELNGRNYREVEER